jgi:hypothetical protein
MYYVLYEIAGFPGVFHYGPFNEYEALLKYQTILAFEDIHNAEIVLIKDQQ